ncbi:hypothetical protein [Arcticibacter sp. MXS-1]|uniref:hypothetical protein n=1 Tax=Arcticibacter sp. MXS-1 TaxID=3341726 RepID=UPI0035A85358
MKPKTLDILSALIEINSERVIAYERALRELRQEEDPDQHQTFDKLTKESHQYREALRFSL